jgi:hypothetical protein
LSDCEAAKFHHKSWRCGDGMAICRVPSSPGSFNVSECRRILPRTVQKHQAGSGRLPRGWRNEVGQSGAMSKSTSDADASRKYAEELIALAPDDFPRPWHPSRNRTPTRCGPGANCVRARLRSGRRPGSSTASPDRAGISLASLISNTVLARNGLTCLSR